MAYMHYLHCFQFSSRALGWKQKLCAPLPSNSQAPLPLLWENGENRFCSAGDALTGSDFVKSFSLSTK